MSTDWISLREFLDRGTICHPTMITSLHVSDETGITMRFRGVAWWRSDISAEAEYEFRFLGIKEACLNPSLVTQITQDWQGADDEILETFEHAPVSETPWGRGQEHNIFCSSPIKNPQKLLLILDAAMLAANSPYNLMSHLNDDFDRLDVFFQLCGQNLFKLGTFRGDILDAVREELTSQAVRFTEFPGPTRIDGCVFTCIEDSFILSDTAQAREIGDLQDVPDHPL